MKYFSHIYQQPPRRQCATLALLSAILILALSLPPGKETTLAQIVNNSPTSETSEDSVTVAALSLDSLGNPTGADSFYVVIFSGGNSNSAVFSDGGTSAMIGLDTVIIGGLTYYYYSRKTSDIDGDGSPGVYDGLIIAKSTGLNLSTVSRFSFQIVGWELDDIGDSAGLAAVHAKASHDTLDNGFASLAPVTVDSLTVGVITDTSIANLAIDIDEFRGALAATQLENGVMDSGAIAGWVWNTPASNHTNTATFGSYLDAKVSALSGGSGAFSVTFTLFDSSSNQTLPGAAVTVRNISQSAIMALGSAGNNGAVSFNLDADSFVVAARLLGYIFPAYDTVVISGATNDTIPATAFDPGAPAAANLVRAWGYITDIAGIPDTSATVSAVLTGGVARASGTIVSPFSVSATTDTTGYFFLDLLPNSTLTPDSSTYQFTIVRSDGTILRKRLVAPDSTSWRLTW